MSNRKTTASARTLVLSTVALALAGCTTISNVFENDKVDYRSARKASTLDVPPDLTQLAKDNRYAIPDGRGVATASGLQQPNQPVAAAAGEQVGPVGTAQAHIERAGNQRWLVIKETPEQLWPQLKDFWHDNGFNIGTENAATGVMETDWTENRAKIPQDFIRNTLGKVIDGLYSSGEKDKFRTRLERNPDGTTEVYISHRGVEEVMTGPTKEIAAWQPRANDPGLEAIFLSKLLSRLTATEPKVAKQIVETATPAPLHAKLAGSAVEVDEGFDRAWRRVGLALDRLGFTVEDRDRVQGVYFVRYVDPDALKNQSFLSKLLSIADSDKDKLAQKYRVKVTAASGATTSQVTVLDNDGKPDTSPTAAKILKILTDELK
ncbi:MAG: outer membrane protein assembly factor BamC [Telluria sp.]